jgi:hypothetical protein
MSIQWTNRYQVVLQGKLYTVCLSCTTWHKKREFLDQLSQYQLLKKGDYIFWDMTQRNVLEEGNLQLINHENLNFRILK